jgi:hypothetical protein
MTYASDTILTNGELLLMANARKLGEICSSNTIKSQLLAVS